MNPFGTKPKRIRTKKTIEEKLNDLAGKALLEAMKKDPEVLRQYVMKQYGIDIRTQGERMISQVVEQTKQRVIWKVAADITEDPEVQEILRDKIVSELLGVSPHQPRAKEKGERSQRPNIQGQFEKMKATIQLANKYREFFGVNESIWSKVVQNPEFMKMAMGLIQGLMGSFGLPQSTAAADGNGQRYFVLIDDQYVEMDHDAFVQYTSKKKVLESPAATPIKPDQKEAKDKPAAAKGNPKPWLPPIAPPAKIPEAEKKELQEVVPQPTSVPPNAGDSFKVCVAKIVDAMDKSVGDFVNKSVASCQSGDKESLKIRDFMLAHNYHDILKELSPDCGYAERFEKNREWYDQVREGLRTQL